MKPPEPTPRRARLLARPLRGLWLAAFGAWVIALWWLSARSAPLGAGPDIPHFDKLCHFVFFAAGAFLFAAFLFATCPRKFAGPAALALTIALLAAIGGLDEWHQSFTPGRQGNDPADWLADLAGAAAGAASLRRFAAPLRPTRSGQSQFA